MATTAPAPIMSRSIGSTRYVDRRKNVLKLAQGEFVAVANLEAVFAGAALSADLVYGTANAPSASRDRSPRRAGRVRDDQRH